MRVFWLAAFFMLSAFPAVVSAQETIPQSAIPVRSRPGDTYFTPGAALTASGMLAGRARICGQDYDVWSAYDDERLYIVLAGQRPTAKITIKVESFPGAPGSADPPFDDFARTFTIAPDATDLANLKAKPPASLVVPAPAERLEPQAQWEGWISIPLDKVAVDDDRTRNTQVGVGETLIGITTFSHLADLPHRKTAWVSTGYGVAVGPNADKAIDHRSELRAHAYAAAPEPLRHLDVDGIAGQTSIISTPQQMKILKLAPPTGPVADALSNIIFCPGCAQEYRAQTAAALQRHGFSKFFGDDKLDVASTAIDDRIYDASRELGPLDASATVSRNDPGVRLGASFLKGTTAKGGTVFDDAILHFGRETHVAAKQPLDIYLTHVVANHANGRSVDSDATLHYAYEPAHLHLVAEYASQYKAQAQNVSLFGGLFGAPLSGTVKLDLLAGWRDSGPGYGPRDGTADIFYGTKSAWLLARVKRDGNARGTGASSLTLIGRRLLDGTRVLRSDVDVQAEYALSRLFSVSSEIHNRPSAARVFAAEAGAVPTIVDSHAAVPGEWDVMPDLRDTATLNYTLAAARASATSPDHYVSASVGISDFRTRCLTTATFSCSALPRRGIEGIGSLAWLTSGGQLFSVRHKTASGAGVVGQTGISDGFVAGTAIAPCGSAYVGMSNTLQSSDPTQNGKALTASIVHVVKVYPGGGAIAIAAEYTRKLPLQASRDNPAVNIFTLKADLGTQHRYGATDVARCSRP